jgi:GNAT superfamily N-acetyltransferase
LASVGNWVERARVGLRNRGVARVAALAARRAVAAVHLDSSHVWYELDLTGERPTLELPPGMPVRRGTTDADFAFATATSDQVGETTVRRRRAAGQELWIVGSGEPVGFFWVFAGVTPSVAAPGEALELPPGTVAIEDTYTSPALRGQSVAPAAWLAVAEQLAAGGHTSVVMTIEPDNGPSRRAAEKAGFRLVGEVRLKRRAGRTRVTVDVIEPGDFSARLASLER